MAKQIGSRERVLYWWQAAEEKTKQRLYIGLLLVAVVVVYGNSLRNSFTMDDELYIQRNPQVLTPTLGRLFAPNKVSNVFRPVTFATLAANWFAGGDKAWGFHLLNLLLHAGAVCLLYLLLKELLAPWAQGNLVAFAAALIFAVHPIHTEAVSSIVGRAEVLAGGFLFAAWLLHLQGREILALVCFVMALLSKESAVIFLPLVVVGDVAIGKIKSYWRYGGIAGVTALYVAVLWKLQGGHFGSGMISKVDNPLAGDPALWRILNALHVAWKYVALQIYPVKLSSDYSFDEIPVYFDLRHTLPWAVATFVVLLVWIWAWRKGKSAWVLAAGIYLAGFAVTANVLMPIGTIMGERLAYLPSAGFCLLVALAWRWLEERRRDASLAVLVLLVAALGVRTAVRNRDWRDNLTIFTAAVQAAPRSAKTHANLGYAYLERGQNVLARKELEAALQIHPEFADAMESLGLLESRAGNYQAAGRMLESAFYQSGGRNNPNYDYIAVNLAAIYIQTDHLDGALELLNREIADAPDYGRAWSNRAVIRYKRGELAAARSDAETALRLEPDNRQARNLMQLLNAQQPGSKHSQ